MVPFGTTNNFNLIFGLGFELYNLTYYIEFDEEFIEEWSVYALRFNKNEFIYFSVSRSDAKYPNDSAETPKRSQRLDRRMLTRYLIWKWEIKVDDLVIVTALTLKDQQLVYDDDMT